MMKQPGDIVKAYTSKELENILHSKDWQQLQPNYPNCQDLPANELSVDQVEQVAQTALKLTAGGLSVPHYAGEHANLTAPTDPMSWGTLEFVGTGDQKTCYRLRTELGSIAVQIVSHDENLGIVVPPSRYLTPIREDPVLRLWEYADVRSYLVLPYRGSVGVRFQEDGGQAYPSSLLPYALVMKGLVRQRTLRRIKKEITVESRDWQYSRNEIEHARHYLKKQGYALPLVIDIPVEERNWNYKSTD